MFRGYWLAAIALGLTTILALSPWLGSPAYGQERQQHAQQATDGNDDPVESSGFWSAYAAPRDTYAQWIMAIFSIVATGVSVGAVILVRDTLRANTAAVDLAREANNLTREAMIADKRAWIAIEDVVLLHPTCFSEERLNLRVEAVFKNVGSTPARDLSIKIESIHLGEPPDDFSGHKKRHLNGARNLLPGLGITLFPNEPYVYRLLWGDPPEHFRSSIHTNPVTEERKIALTIFVTAAYRVHGDTMVHITHRAYSALNVPIGFNVPDGVRQPIEPLPFMSDEAD